jgi:hypothetical protein
MASFKTDLIGVCSAIAAATVLLAILLFGLGNIAFGTTTWTNTIGGNIIVVGTCAVNVVNTLIYFNGGTAMAMGSNSPVSNIITVNDLNGNEPANILVYGTNWAVPSTLTFNFLVTNTVWDYTIHSTTIAGNQLQGTVQDTYTQIAGNGNKNLYFGTNVPTAATGNTVVPPGTYTQSIYIELSCP